MPRKGNQAMAASKPFFSVLDFGIEISKEKIENNGEDSYLYSFTPQSGIAGVFDGCGGSGAKRYEKYRNKTGAYMASRVTAGAAKDWFLERTAEKTPAALKDRVREYLSLCKQVGGGTASFKGSMAKDYPTTAALVVASIEGGNLMATCLWAGDSRCYLLDEDGLKQLTDDDLGGIDAMENLTQDGVLTNVISASKDFSIHEKTLEIVKPGILFAATDGCFGYLSTPMEFEQLLLSTLSGADTVRDWEEAISAFLKDIAGDDFTISGMSFGFGSFANLKKSLNQRHRYLYENFTADISEKTQEEKIALWKKYQIGYSKYLSEG